MSKMEMKEELINNFKSICERNSDNPNPSNFNWEGGRYEVRDNGEFYSINNVSSVFNPYRVVFMSYISGAKGAVISESEYKLLEHSFMVVWNKIKTTEKPSLPEGVPVKTVAFITRKNKEYFFENGDVASADIILQFEHVISGDYGYIIIPD